MQPSEAILYGLSRITFGLSIFFDRNDDIAFTNIDGADVLIEKFHFVEDEKWIDLKITPCYKEKSFDVEITFPYVIKEDKLDDAFILVNQMNSTGTPCATSIDLIHRKIQIKTYVTFTGFHDDEDNDSVDYSHCQDEVTLNFFASIFGQAESWWRWIELVAESDTTAVNLINQRNKFYSRSA